MHQSRPKPAPKRGKRLIILARPSQFDLKRMPKHFLLGPNTKPMVPPSSTSFLYHAATMPSTPSAMTEKGCQQQPTPAAACPTPNARSTPQRAQAVAAATAAAASAFVSALQSDDISSKRPEVGTKPSPTHRVSQAPAPSTSSSVHPPNDEPSKDGNEPSSPVSDSKSKASLEESHFAPFAFETFQTHASSHGSEEHLINEPLIASPFPSAKGTPGLRTPGLQRIDPSEFFHPHRTPHRTPSSDCAKTNGVSLGPPSTSPYVYPPALNGDSEALHMPFSHFSLLSQFEGIDCEHGGAILPTDDFTDVKELLCTEEELEWTRIPKTVVKKKKKKGKRQQHLGKEAPQAPMPQKAKKAKLGDAGTNKSKPTIHLKLPTNSVRQVKPAKEEQTLTVAKVPNEGGVIRCNCKHSRCLKLYCDCFQGSAKCTDACCCLKCQNTDEHDGPDGIRRETIRTILSRRPDAFEKKERTADDGCKCKKNRCLKKYCNCFNNGINCIDGKCICANCQNKGDSASSSLIKVEISSHSSHGSPLPYLDIASLSTLSTIEMDAVEVSPPISEDRDSCAVAAV